MFNKQINQPKDELPEKSLKLLLFASDSTLFMNVMNIKLIPITTIKLSSLKDFYLDVM